MNVLLFVSSVLGAVRNSPLPPPRLFISGGCCAPSGFAFGVSAGGRACSAGRGGAPRSGLAPGASSSASSSSATPGEILTLRGEMHVVAAWLLVVGGDRVHANGRRIS